MLRLPVFIVFSLFLLVMPVASGSAAIITRDFTAANGTDTFTGTFSFDDAAVPIFSNATTAQYSGGGFTISVMSSSGLDITLPIVLVTVKNDDIPASDPTTFGIRDQFDIFASNSIDQSMNFSLTDFFNFVTDPNDALNSTSLADAVNALDLDPFVAGEPWSRGTIGLNGAVSALADLTSVTGAGPTTSLPSPPTLALFAFSFVLLGSVARRHRQGA